MEIKLTSEAQAILQASTELPQRVKNVFKIEAANLVNQHLDSTNYCNIKKLIAPDLIKAINAYLLQNKLIDTTLYVQTTLLNTIYEVLDLELKYAAI